MAAVEVLFGIALGWIAAFFFEKYYVERASVLPNVVAIFLLMWPSWNQVNQYIQLFILIGLLLGAIALAHRLKNRKTSGWMYGVTYPFYSGKTLMPIYTMIIFFREYFPTQLFLTPFWIAVAALICAAWYYGINKFDNDPPFK